MSYSLGGGSVIDFVPLFSLFIFFMLSIENIKTFFKIKRYIEGLKSRVYCFNYIIIRFTFVFFTKTMTEKKMCVVIYVVLITSCDVSVGNTPIMSKNPKKS